MQTYATGKALLVITRTEGNRTDKPNLDIEVYLQSLNAHGRAEKVYAEDSVRELIWCMGYYQSWIDINLTKMEIGATWRVYIQFEAAGSTDYWGEYDEELTINKCRTLRKQKPRKYYQCKSHK